MDQVTISLLVKTQALVFFRNYTKLAMLVFLYCFVVKSKINSTKSLPPMGIEPVDPRGTPVIHSHTFPTELTWKVLIEGYLTSLEFVHELTIGLR